MQERLVGWYFIVAELIPNFDLGGTLCKNFFLIPHGSAQSRS
jgi:hypothetical protein